MKHYLASFSVGLLLFSIFSYGAVTINSVATNTGGGGGTTTSKTQARYEGFAGLGATATKIPYWTTETENVGTSFTADNDSTDGLTITINDDGVYAFDYCYSDDDGAGYFGVTLNASPTTDVLSLADPAERLIHSNPFGANFISCLSWTGWLDAGDVVRPHTHGSPNTGLPGRNSFSAARVY